MSYTVEKIEGSKAKFTITVESEAFNAARDKAFKRNKNRLSVPGFRKGKVPRKMIEKMYGKEVFDDDAINLAAPDAYEEAMKDCDLEIISRPSYEMVDVNDDDTFVFTATVAIRPEVKLGDYKGIEVEKRTVKVLAADVNAELDRIREQNSRKIEVTDRAVKKDDIVKIDFDGYVDDKAFAGGKGEDYDLVIGSHSFIDDFQDQLIGKNIGDDVDVNVTFPEEYHEQSLAGKPALFKVKIKGITEKELPKLDDEFAEEVSEFETLKEYKDDIKKNLTERRKKEAADAKEAEALEKLVESTDVDIPEEAIDDQTEELVREFGYRMQMQGMDPQTYMKMTGMTPEVLMGQMRPEAERRLKTRFILEAIVDAEKIVADEAEVDKEIEDIAKMYRQKPEDYKKSLSDRELDSIKKEIAVKAAAKLVADKAKEVERESASTSEE